MRHAILSLSGIAVLAGCSGSGVSADEARTAAIDRARQELNLPVTAPLEARVWVGKEFDGEPVLCGTVSDPTPGSPVPPQRFVARTDPFDWLVFEAAHASMVQAQPDKFFSWAAVCSGAQAG